MLLKTTNNKSNKNLASEMLSSQLTGLSPHCNEVNNEPKSGNHLLQYSAKTRWTFTDQAVLCWVSAIVVVTWYCFGIEAADAVVLGFSVSDVYSFFCLFLNPKGGQRITLDLITVAARPFVEFFWIVSPFSVQKYFLFLERLWIN